MSKVNSLDDVLKPASPMPENLPLETASGESDSAASSDHLEGLTIAEPEGGAAPVVMDGAAGPQVWDKDQFFANFAGAFNLGAALSALQSLKVDTGDQTARAASDAIYDIALETPWLRFLIEPSNVWLQRAMAIGAFAVPKAMAVRAELAARAKVAKPAKGGAAAPAAEKSAMPDWAPKDAKAAA